MKTNCEPTLAFKNIQGIFIEHQVWTCTSLLTKQLFHNQLVFAILPKWILFLLVALKFFCCLACCLTHVCWIVFSWIGSWNFSFHYLLVGILINLFPLINDLVEDVVVMFIRVFLATQRLGVRERQFLILTRLTIPWPKL